MNKDKPTVMFGGASPTADAVAAAKARTRLPQPPVRIPPLDATGIEGGGTMHQQAPILSDPRSPMSPNFVPPKTGDVPRGISAETESLLRQAQAESARIQTAELQKQEEAAAAEASARTPAADIGAREAEEKAKGLKSLLGDEEWNALDNPLRRSAIENRLDPMDLTSILTTGELEQRVVVIPPSRLIYTFRTVSGQEDLALKGVAQSIAGSDRYVFDSFSLMQVTLALSAINDVRLPSHLLNGEFNKDLFDAKFKILMRYPMAMLADIGLNAFWFDLRVRALFAYQGEGLKNS